MFSFFSVYIQCFFYGENGWDPFSFNCKLGHAVPPSTAVLYSVCEVFSCDSHTVDSTDLGERLGKRRGRRRGEESGQMCRWLKGTSSQRRNPSWGGRGQEGPVRKGRQASETFGPCR